MTAHRRKHGHKPKARLLAARGAKKWTPRLRGRLLLCRGRPMEPRVPHLYRKGETVRKSNIITAIVLTHRNGGGEIGDQADRSTSLLN